MAVTMVSVPTVKLPRCPGIEAECRASLLKKPDKSPYYRSGWGIHHGTYPARLSSGRINKQC